MKKSNFSEEQIVRILQEAASERKSGETRGEPEHVLGLEGENWAWRPMMFSNCRSLRWGASN